MYRKTNFLNKAIILLLKQEDREGILWKVEDLDFNYKLPIRCACVHAKLFQSFLTLWNPMDCSPPGSSLLRSPVRMVEWVVMPSSRGSSWPRDETRVSYGSCIGRQVLYYRIYSFWHLVEAPRKLSGFSQVVLSTY